MKQMLLSALAGGLLLAGCASQQAGPATTKAVQQTRAGLGEAAMTPLEDLNLKRDEIPEILRNISSPYDVPADTTCEEIEAEITALNNVLGPDWDAPPQEDDSTLGDKAADTASDGVLKAVASEAGGIIPYRGWVRQLTGAAAHQKKVKKAIERGSHRRTYLKAFGLMKGCAPVATPNLDVVEAGRTEIDFRGDAPPDYAQKETEAASGPAAEDTSTGFNLDPAPVQEEALPVSQAEKDAIKTEAKTSSPASFH